MISLFLLFSYRLDRPATTLQPNRTKKKPPSRRRRQALPIASTTLPPDPHEKSKYTYEPSHADTPSVDLPSDKKGSDEEIKNKTVTDPLDTTKKINNTWPKENPYFKAFVYEEREMVIPNLGHFEDYNIEVCKFIMVILCGPGKTQAVWAYDQFEQSLRREVA